MAKQAHELLADATEAESALAVNNIVHSALLGKTHRMRLVKAGFVKSIIRGWYLLDADLKTQETGESVLWHESYQNRRKAPSPWGGELSSSRRISLAFH